MVNSPSKILVTDFDGTMTRHDFYALVEGELLSPEVPEYWRDYRAGRITHFEALQFYFAAIRADEQMVLKLVARMELDPHLTDVVAQLRSQGWDIVVASAGCRWYIDKLLSTANVELEVHANPGQFVTGRGLLMELPTASPFFSATHGIDKAAVVRYYLSAGAEVAFAGDGLPDLEAAKLVIARNRFARGDLAGVLRQERIPFESFNTWSDVVRILLSNKARP